MIEEQEDKQQQSQVDLFLETYIQCLNVCSWLFSGVRTSGSCLLALIYSSSITDVSAVIYELRGEGGGKIETWLEVASDHMVGSLWVSV